MPASPSGWTDIELVDHVVHGKPGATEEFYRRHSRLIYHCIRVRAERQDVDDLFQAFFERLMRHQWRPLRLWQRGTSLPIYLAAVVRNFVIDFHRARRWREQPAGSVTDMAPLLDRHAAAPAETGQLRELRRLAVRAWARLEPRDRRLVCDKYHRDLDNEAMAVRLNLSAGALRTASSRAQARFLGRLADLAPEFFPGRA